MEAGTSPQPQNAAPYSAAAVVGAALATLLLPPIALIAALLLLGNERSPERRSQLRTWAWASGGVTVLAAALSSLQFVTLH
jgi:hypothetical protein